MPTIRSTVNTGRLAIKNTINVDLQEVSEFLRDKNGPLFRHMNVVGDAIKAETVALMKGFPRGFLGPRIVKRVLIEQDGPHVLVGSDLTKTRPHRIEGNPFLAFHWKRVGRFMVVRSVNHPGSEFGPYLLARLDLAALNVGRRGR